MEAALFKDAFFKLSHYSGNLKSFILPIEKRKQSSFLTSLKKKKIFFHPNALSRQFFLVVLKTNFGVKNEYLVLMREYGKETQCKYWQWGGAQIGQARRWKGKFWRKCQCVA